MPQFKICPGASGGDLGGGKGVSRKLFPVVELAIENYAARAGGGVDSFKISVYISGFFHVSGVYSIKKLT